MKKDLGIDNVRYDLIRPVGNGHNKKLIPTNSIWQNKSTTRQFPNCTLEMFKIMKYGHNCFFNKICVTASGEVIPCIMERSVILGNAFKNNFEEIIGLEKSKRVRRLSKDFIEICKDCEYRYGCFDCRPKAKKSLFDKENLYTKPDDCTYNPYTAKWE